MGSPHQRRVGYLTQQYHMFPHLTVAENIAYGLPKRTIPAARERVRKLVQTFHLEGLEQRRSCELSGGEQQRVTLARALASGPDVLLLDEPFTALDVELRRTLRKELRSILEKADIPVLLVTHDREEALALGDSVQVIDGGRPLARGEPLAILGQPGRGRVARLMGVENLFRLRVKSHHPQDGTMVCIGEGAAAGGTPGRSSGGRRAPHCGRGNGHGGHPRLGHHPGPRGAAGNFGPEPATWPGPQCGAAPAGLRSHPGLRGITALSHYRLRTSRDRSGARPDPVGGVQGLILLPGPGGQSAIEAIWLLTVVFRGMLGLEPSISGGLRVR